MARSSKSANRGILDGIRVIDLTTFVTGGFTTLMMANLGAEVIKVERPGFGDDIRHAGPPFRPVEEHDGPGISAAEEGEPPYFWTLNYGKRSIEIDLKTDEGLELLYDLVEDSDVFVENFRPGTAERLGIGYDELTELNEELIYCSISAFGEDGPWSDRPGYDLLVQGMSGIMSVTGPEDGDPVKVGLPMTDLITAMWSAFGIMGALYRRERTGEGERVELGMLDAALPWMTKQAGKVFVGEEPKRMGMKDPVLAPYQGFPTEDGYLNVACGNQKLWESLTEALGREDLRDDPRFETNPDRVENMDELEEELTAVFEQRSAEEWTELLAEEHGLPVAPVYSVEKAISNEQVAARGVIDEIEHPAKGSIPVIEHPLNFDGSSTGFDRAPPLLGEDTLRLLRESGYSDDEIASLKESGAIPDR